MKAVKDNKVYSINETQKASYLNQGFNITDDNGKVLEHSPLSKVPYGEYNKVKTELEAVKAENETLKAEIETLKATTDTKKTAKSKSEE